MKRKKVYTFLIIISTCSWLQSQISNVDLIGNYLVSFKSWNCSEVQDHTGILYIRSAGTTTCLAEKDSSYTTNNTFSSSITFSVQSSDSSFHGCNWVNLTSGKYYSNDSIHLYIRYFASAHNFCAHEYFGKKINTIDINESESKKGTLSIYPNPVSGVLNLTFPVFITNEAGVQIINQLGQTILKARYSSSIDVALIPVGVYILKITDENKSYYGKFVKE